MRQKRIEKAEFRLLAFGRRRAGGQIQRNNRQFAEIGADIASFGIEFRMFKALDDTVRLLSAPDADAAVTLLYRRMVVGVHAIRHPHFRRQIRQLRLEFLQADDVGGLRSRPREHVFAPGAADTIEIQGDDA